MYLHFSTAAPVVAGLVMLFDVQAPTSAFVSAKAPTSEELFDSSVLHEIRLNINSRDLKLLRQGYLSNTYYTADLTFRNSRLRSVAVRSRGNYTRDATKLGLTVDFDRYTPGRTFMGLRSLVLDNLVADPSMLRDILASEMFRRMGQRAPRQAMCRLYINNDYQGVYAMVEDIDPVYLKQTFGRDDGYLFEYKRPGYYYGDSLGADLNAYEPIFQPRTHKSEPAAILFEPIRRLLEAMTDEAEASRETLDSVLDLEQFVTLLAIETFQGEEDGFAGVNGINNFYLYREARSLRHSMIVWDRDRAFTFLYSSIFERLNEVSFARRALAHDDLRSRYLDVLEATAHSVDDSGWLAAEIERLSALIRPFVYQDVRQRYSNTDFDEAIDFLRVWAAVRPGVVLEQVAMFKGNTDRNQDPNQESPRR